MKIGQNLIDLSKNLDSMDICTVLIPLGEKTGESDVEGLDKRLTIESVNSGRDYLVGTASGVYGNIWKTVTWNDVTTPAALKAKGQDYLDSAQWANLVIEATAFDLGLAIEDVQTFRVLDMIRVVSEPHGINRNFMLTKLQINLNNPGATKITLGEEKKLSLSAQSAAAKAEIERAETTIMVDAANNTRQILETSTQGNVYFRYNEDGVIYEIDIMDTDDPATATKIWRWNMGGWGYSNDGGQTYTVAATMDGVINASMIKAGILQGIQIIAEEGLIGGWSILEDALSKSGTFDLTGVDIVTLNYITRYFRGAITLEEAIANGADINGDGRVDYLDQALCVLTMLGLVSTSGSFTAQATTENGFSAFSTIVNGETVFAGGVHGVFGKTGTFEQIRLFNGADGQSGYISPQGIGVSIYDVSNNRLGSIQIGYSGIVVQNASGTTKATYPSHLYGVAQGYTRIAYNTTNSYAMTSVSNLGDYQAFVLVATRGVGKGVMEAVTIPKAIATQCTSDAVCSWVYSAQNGAYSGQCYFDFTNNRVYLKSSGNADCRVELYGFAI